MGGIRTVVAALAVMAVIVVAGGVLASAQATRSLSAQGGSGQTPGALPLSQTVRERGSSVTGSFEGWYHGKDGNDYAFLGYFNRNTKQELDIPVGPNNRIEPGGPDVGQPTHFQTGRQRGIFAVKLPKDIGSKKLTWTLVSNGFTNVITMHTQPDYIIEPYMNSTSKQVPPVLKFDPNGPSFSGPPVGTAATLSVAPKAPLVLTTYVTGDQGGRGLGGGGAAPSDAAGAPGAAAGGARGARGGAAAAGAFGRGGGGPNWSKYRGPGTVTFAAVPRATGAPAPTDGKAQTTATFDAAGDYTIRVQTGSANGEQCCWTNAHVKVTVK